MNKELHRLKPSTRIGPIPIGVLRELPLGGVYVQQNVALGRHGIPFQIISWNRDLDAGLSAALKAFQSTGSVFPEGWREIVGEVCYPLLPALTFTMTVDQMTHLAHTPSGRQKYVTRRKNRPKWCEPGRYSTPGIAASGEARAWRVD